MWHDLARRRELRVLAVVAVVAGVLVLAGRKVDIATLRSLSLTWRWIATSIALNTLSAVLKAGVWDSALRAMPAPLRLPFRDLCRSVFIGLCLNTVVPGRVGEAARVASLKRRHPSAPVPVLVGSVVGEHILSSLALIATVVALLLGVDRGVAGRFETTLLGLLAVVAALAISLTAIVYLLQTRSARRRFPPVRERYAGGVRLVRDVAHGLRGGIEIFRQGRRQSSGLGIVEALASSAAQVASIYAALTAVGIDASLGRAGAAFIASSLVGIFPLIPGNIGAFQAVVAASLVTFNVDFGLGFAFAIALQALEAVVGVGIGGWFLLREGLSLASYRDAPLEDG
ncbi:MAG: phosphatidyl-myo-inositol alpha-mannosyltransferase [Gaiellales bacterium]|nr:phosphatidyl-myo-inositol alpha-mannosyltransferase [Gaiellales bacterium]